MNCRERLEEYFLKNEVPYEVQHHRRAFTAQEVAASEHISGKFLAKVVIGYADEKMVMLVLPASEVVYPRVAARLLGAKSFVLAREDQFARIFSDCELGTMPPFGNLYGLPVYVDVKLTEDEIIFFQAGSSTETMSTRYADFARLVKPTVISFIKEPSDSWAG
jgi:Ala-tRNA(Pro) deacylase